MAESDNVTPISDEVSEIEAEDQKSAESVEDDIPPEFRGKSAAEIAKQALYFRSQMGKQAHEVGELRRLTDQLLQVQLKPKEEDKPKEVDFFENPQEAVRRQIESNPELQQVKALALQAKQEQARLKLQQLHPDFTQVVQDTEFAEWVKSSKIRQKLFMEAENYDVDAADELLSTYKQLRNVRTKAVEATENKARRDVASKASVDSGGSGESSKKIYRRADLIQLKLRDPQAYAARQDEIMRAYAEGRVR